MVMIQAGRQFKIINQISSHNLSKIVEVQIRTRFWETILQKHLNIEAYGISPKSIFLKYLLIIAVLAFMVYKRIRSDSLNKNSNEPGLINSDNIFDAEIREYFSSKTAL